MKKILLMLIIFTLCSCSKTDVKKTPHEILLSIENYKCQMQISYFSNKNYNQYTATQSYYSNGKYFMEFLDENGLKINFDNAKLNISSNILNTNISYENYNEINNNPLFLSYFISTYFNIEDSKNLSTNDNYISLVLPSYTDHLYSATLEFKNNLPYSLTYFDKNGNEKVNIIYSEFTFI